MELATFKHMAHKRFSLEPEDWRMVWWLHNDLKGWTHARAAIAEEDEKRAPASGGPITKLT